jgi:CO/xanthine dehydrogenase Mo-binding subunit
VSYQIVGQPIPRTDNTGKVTGDAHYTSDILLPGTLWAKTLRSPYAHARISRIDTSRAEKAPSGTSRRSFAWRVRESGPWH